MNEIINFLKNGDAVTVLVACFLVLVIVVDTVRERR